ncbi:hypothetical protein C0991_006460 [Blastosporella zonata]|nr:hypothetical protein C0991_006460 [Blastosporella zonata]
MAEPVEPKKADSTPQDNSKAESEKWISILENTTSAPWLFSAIPQAENKLAFETAPAPAQSEIGRARVAVPVILRATVHHLSTVPLNSPIRTEHPDIFDIFGALQAIHDMYLTEKIPDLETWTSFWARAQPVVLELGMKLDEKGFGLPKDDVESEGEQKPSE